MRGEGKITHHEACQAAGGIRKEIALSMGRILAIKKRHTNFPQVWNKEGAFSQGIPYRSMRTGFGGRKKNVSYVAVAKKITCVVPQRLFFRSSI